MDSAELKLKSGLVIDAAMRVHSALGPGLLESAYQACLEHELVARGLRVSAQQALPVVYRAATIDVGYRLDLVVEAVMVVELKAVEKLLPIHEAQLLSYLRLGRFPLGLLINFHSRRLRHGIRRLVNDLEE